MGILRNKIRYIPLASDISIINSEVLTCTYDGQRCLHRYIKTRVNQPDICLNCLIELNIRDNYKLIEKKCDII